MYKVVLSLLLLFGFFSKLIGQDETFNDSTGSFYLFGHKGISTHISNRDSSIISKYAIHKGSKIPTGRRLITKYSSGLYEINFEGSNLLDFYNEMSFETGNQFTVIGNINVRGSANIESFSTDYIIDEISFQNGIIAVKELNRYILYGIGAECLVNEKDIIYHYKPRNISIDELYEILGELELSAQVTPLIVFNEFIVKGNLSEIQETISILRYLDRPVERVSIELLVVEYMHGSNFQWSFDVTAGSFGRISEGGYSPRGGALTGTYDFLSQLKPNFKVNLQALIEKSYANIVTNPHIMAMTNKEAEITITETQYIRLQEAGLTGISTNLEEIEASLNLRITPTILNDQLIRLDLHSNNTEFSPSNSQESIQTSSNTIDTKVVIRNGETLIIGGLIKAEESDGQGGFPLLRRIPLVGLLFKKSIFNKTYKETVIYITPYMYPLTNSVLEYKDMEKPQPAEMLKEKSEKQNKKGINKFL